MGWVSQRAAGSLDWVFLAFQSSSQSLMRYSILYKFGADLEPASCFTPCWINVLFSRSSNMKYIKSKLKTGQCFASNAMGIFVFKSSFSTPQIFPTKFSFFLFFFWGRDYFFPSVKGHFLSPDLFRNLHGENGPDPTQVKLYFLIWDTVGSPEKCIFLQDCKEEYIVFV